MIGDVDVCNDDAHFHKGLVSIEQAQLNKIVNARLLKVGQVFCVVDVSLRVEIPIADFSWVEEFVIVHCAIIEQMGKSVAESSNIFQPCLNGEICSKKDDHAIKR